MSKKVVGVLAVVLLSIAVGGGYWLGQKGTDSAMATKSAGGAAAPAGGAARGRVDRSDQGRQGVDAAGHYRGGQSALRRVDHVAT